LDTKISPGTIERRRRELMQVQRQISKRKKKAWIGREFDVLLEGPAEETDLLWQGRTEMHAPEIDGKLYVNDFGGITDPQPGQFYRWQLTEARDYDVIARLTCPFACLHFVSGSARVGSAHAIPPASFPHRTSYGQQRHLPCNIMGNGPSSPKIWWL